MKTSFLRGAVQWRDMPGRFWLAAMLAASSPGLAGAAEMVQIHARFPGGNVLVQKIEGNTVHIAPDLRGGRPWFYWHFEAEASQLGRVRFVFPDDAGDQIGMNGPAVSLDDGQTWKWLGAEHVRYRTIGQEANRRPADEFSYEFAAPGQKARFSVGIPYLQSHLEAFTKSIGKNPHLTTDVLARSRNGRPVQVWQIGQDGPGVTPVLVSARHHACEAMASYVLEGFLREALSDSPAATAFRKQYVVYAVPIVDVDGVEAGDQGKWRSPHDHNRDYGRETMLYPPVIAMVELAKAKRIELALDFHCPTLRMDIHQGFYFAGIRLPHIKRNLDELIAWMDEERPPTVTGPERDLMDMPGPAAPKGGMPFSNFFAYQEGVKFAATLECPYTLRGAGLDDAMAREYGKGLLRAWSKSRFTGPESDSVRSEWGSAAFVAFRQSFLEVFKSNPTEAESLARKHLDNSQAPAIYRVEANNLLGLLRAHQRKYAEALQHYDAALAEAQASASQRAMAAAERARIVSVAPGSSADALARALEDFAAVPYPSAKQRASVHQAAAKAYEARSDFEKALVHARAGSAVAGKYDRGAALNRVAALHDKLGQKEQAIAVRQEAVAVLRKELDPVPVGGFAPQMAADLLDALNGIPTATPAEKQAAADIALNHKVQIPSVLLRVRAGLRD